MTIANKDDFESLDERALAMTTGGGHFRGIVQSWKILGNGLVRAVEHAGSAGAPAAMIAPQGA